MTPLLKILSKSYSKPINALFRHYPISGFVVAGVGPVYITGLAEK